MSIFAGDHVVVQRYIMPKVQKNANSRRQLADSWLTGDGLSFRYIPVRINKSVDTVVRYCQAWLQHKDQGQRTLRHRFYSCLRRQIPIQLLDGPRYNDAIYIFLLLLRGVFIKKIGLWCTIPWSPVVIRSTMAAQYYIQKMWTHI